MPKSEQKKISNAISKMEEVKLAILYFDVLLKNLNSFDCEEKNINIVYKGIKHQIKQLEKVCKIIESVKEKKGHGKS